MIRKSKNNLKKKKQNEIHYSKDVDCEILNKSKKKKKKKES